MAQAKDIDIETFGLGPQGLNLVREVFARHSEVSEVKVFGSRAMDRFEPGSDVDLAVWGDINLDLIARIAAELDQLPLPYKFDVQAYDAIQHLPLKEHIDRIGRTLFHS